MHGKEQCTLLLSVLMSELKVFNALTSTCSFTPDAPLCVSACVRRQPGRALSKVLWAPSCIRCAL